MVMRGSLFRQETNTFFIDNISPMATSTSSIPLPSDADLRRLIHFSMEDGRIWLAEQRMLLMHTATLTNLRTELVRSVGITHARRVLMRAGFASGERDAALARKVRPHATAFDAFAVGPQLHMLEGAVKVTPLSFEFDEEGGHYLGVYHLDQSWEADAHLHDFGPSSESVCWMLLGYASGYTSAFFGRRTYYKEVSCRACGEGHCLIEGRFDHEWPDCEALAEDFVVDSMLQHLDDLRSQIDVLHNEIKAEDGSGPLVGSSAAFRGALELLEKAAPTHVTVLLTGETGVGKERFARTLHDMSPRADKPFIAVNCAALPGELIESELFGAEKGAYTGATATRLGRFERANGGTLLLDEMGELALAAQAKLLRVLQTGEVERLGGTQTIKVDVRVIAATHVDLAAAIEAGRFRRDLFYRLSVFPIRVPPLRERQDDIKALATYLLQYFSAMHDKRIAGFTDHALDTMRHYSWPGNVRELENLIERGVILARSGQSIDTPLLFPTRPNYAYDMVNPNGNLEYGGSDFLKSIFDLTIQNGLGLPALEDGLIQESVRRSEGNLTAAARGLGLTRPQLAYRLQRLQSSCGPEA
tara:strand:+ start:12656 stop:14416 length:1761 start_codon:yes stop_codon:yes gene_type:complete